MTRRAERILARVLWGGYGVLGISGLGLLAWALFGTRPPIPIPEVPLETVARDAAAPVNPDIEELAGKRLSRRVAEQPAEAPRTAAGPQPIDSLLRLRGVLNYSGEKPSVAVLELPGERKTKAFEPGDRIGQTGAVLREVGDTVIVEYERRRYKLTYKGAQELPATTVGDNR